MPYRINITMMLVCSILFCSCMKDHIKGVKEGLPTYVALSISTSGRPVTRADMNADTLESRFYCADVFIFDAATGSQVNHHRLPASAFSNPQAGSGYDAHTYISTTKIATTTGVRKMIVGVNLSQDFSDQLDGEPIATFTTVPYTVDLSSDYGIEAFTGKTQKLSPINYDPVFVMFSAAPLTLTLVKDPDFGLKENSPVVQVQRMVAKISVEMADDIEIITDCDNIKLAWKVNQVNTKTFLVQPADKKDPNWANTPSGDLALNPRYAHFEQTIDAYNTPINARRVYYVPENTTQDFLRGQLTYVQVIAQLQPKRVTVFVNGANGNDGYRDEEFTFEWFFSSEFWMVTYNQGANRAYFSDILIANAFAQDHGGLPVVAYDGRCRWDFFLNPNNNYDVLRNTYYRCTITKIVGIGRPVNSDLPDPHLPPVASTGLTVDVEVLDWDTVLRNIILE